jgi:signal peptidase I
MTTFSNRERDPWIAVNLSVLWPGLGQCYAQAWLKGIALALIAGGLVGFAVWSIFSINGNTLTGLLMLIVLGAVYIGSLLDAYNTLKPLPKPSIADVYQPHQNRWYAVFLSQILPGFGHLYLQQALVGGMFLAAGTLTALLANTYSALLPIPPFIWAIACYHVYRVTPGRKTAQQWVMMTLIIGILATRLTVGYVPVWVNQAFLQFIVPSSSMEPTLQVGDRMFVRRRAQYDPQQGDVVVFQIPESAIALLDAPPDTIFVKRIIGAPGQTVEVRNGNVFINGVPLQEPYIAEPPTYQWGPVRIPLNSYVVLGDNRNSSADSHVWGQLPKENILGKAYKIYWPPKHIQPL